jgi:ribosomal protein S6--L-glutamate ligase
MIRIAVLTARSRQYHPNRRLLEAAQALGHQAYLLHPNEVQAEAGGRKRATTGGARHPEVVLPRIGATIEESELAVVFHMECMGIPCINGFSALALARDKFLSLRRLDLAGLAVPRTFLVTESSQLITVIGKLGGFPVVIKALRGRQGTSVYRVEDMEFAQYMVDRPPRPGEGVLVQQYISTADEGDVRIVVVGGRAVAAMRRIPRKGDFRSNAHLRGKGVPWNPVPDWISMALKATDLLQLGVSGVDMMRGLDGPLILEVNTTPGFRELERVTGVDVAREIICHAVEIAKEKG